eukprot:jgi/Ulvmu1/2702/UM014_0158.1
MTQPIDSGRASPMQAEALVAHAEPAVDADERQTTADVSADADGESLAERLARVAVPVETEVPKGASGVTAFFLFSNVHRQRVKEALQSQLRDSEKLGIGPIGKKIGELWGQCSDETKKQYAERAKQNKENAKATAPGDNPETDGQQTGPKEAPLKLPRSVVKRIVMLDEDQTRITGDALELLSTTAELFLETLAKKAHGEAIGAARSTIAFRDVDSVLRRLRPTAWASSPFLELEPDSKPDNQAPSKAMKDAAAKTKSITSFFRPVA